MPYNIHMESSIKPRAVIIAIAALAIGISQCASANSPLKVAWDGGSCLSTNTRMIPMDKPSTDSVSVKYLRVISNDPFLHWHTISLNHIASVAPTPAENTLVSSYWYAVKADGGKTYTGWVVFQSGSSLLSAKSIYLKLSCIGGAHSTEDYTQYVTISHDNEGNLYPDPSGLLVNDPLIASLTPVTNAEVRSDRISTEKAKEILAAAQATELKQEQKEEEEQAQQAARQQLAEQRAQANAAAARETDEHTALANMNEASRGTYAVCTDSYQPEVFNSSSLAVMSFDEVHDYSCHLIGGSSYEIGDIDSLLVHGWKLRHIQRTLLLFHLSPFAHYVNPPQDGSVDGVSFSVTLEKKG